MNSGYFCFKRGCEFQVTLDNKGALIIDSNRKIKYGTFKLFPVMTALYIQRTVEPFPKEIPFHEHGEVLSASRTHIPQCLVPKGTQPHL